MSDSSLKRNFSRMEKYLPPHLVDRLKAGFSDKFTPSILGHFEILQGALTAYLPRYLVEAVGRDPSPGKLSGEFRFGTAISADVSGFTAMSERLSKLGREGAEELTSIVNSYFEPLLEISLGRGGDLLRFGGDALLLFYEGEMSAAKALATSWAMQSAMVDFSEVQTSQGQFQLRMSIGLGSGQVFTANVGSSEAMDFLTIGTPFNAMAHAEALADAGQIVVDTDTAEATMEFARYQPLKEGLFLLKDFWGADDWTPEVRPLDRTHSLPQGIDPDAPYPEWEARLDAIEALSLFLPRELLPMIISNPEEPLQYSSHRPVTVIFTNFRGMEGVIHALGPGREKKILSILDAYVSSMRKEISDYGGTISKLDPYHVGYRILGLFGALRAHEEDPQRAVAAALSMNSRLEKVNELANAILSDAKNEFADQGTRVLSQRSGVNTGFVFVGDVGSTLRREHTVMGDQVNLTARLMSLARDDEILLGHATARQVRNSYQLAERQPVMVKGFPKPIRNYAVEALEVWQAGQMSIQKGPFIGREGELATGREAIMQAVEGAAGLIVIQGESGIGKSRLAQELAVSTEGIGTDVLLGSCLSYGGLMTFHPWVEILRKAFKMTPEMDVDERKRILDKEMAQIGESVWAPVIGGLLGMEYPENNVTRDLDPEFRRQRILDLMLNIFRARAESRPVLLIIEDFHWADEASGEVIRYVARNAADAPIILMLTARSNGAPQAWEHLLDDTVIDLGPLSGDESLELIESLIGPIEITERLKSLVIERGAGNPLYIEEVMRVLLGKEFLRTDENGVWRLEEGQVPIDLPQTIHGIILSRLDGLAEIDREILRVASVVGTQFSSQLLLGTHEFNTEQQYIHNRLTGLRTKGLVQITGRGDSQYQFAHLTTRDVIYESMAYQLRRKLHRGVGNHLERTHASTLGEYSDVLAHHYFEGQEWKKALSYNLRSARAAQTEFANDASIRLGLKAIEAAENLAPTPETRRQTLASHETLGEVFTLIGQYDEALVHLRDARVILEQGEFSTNRAVKLADVYRKTAQVHERRGDFDSAFRWLEEGLSHLERGAPCIEQARAYLLGTGILRRQGKNEDAIIWCRKSMRIAGEIPSREARQVMAHAFLTLSGIYWRAGEYAKAVDYGKESLSIHQAIDDEMGQAQACINLSNAYADLGAWDMAMQALRQSLEINRRIGNIQSEGFAANNLAYIHLDRGEWEQAIDLFTESKRVWKRLGARFPEAVTLSNLAQVYIYQDDLDEAESCLRESAEIFAEIQTEDYLPELERRWGELYLKRGETDRAIAHIERSIGLASEAGTRLDLGLSHRALGTALMASGDLKTAERTLRESLRILSDLESEFEMARTVVLLARLEILTGEKIERPKLDEAIEVFEKLEAEPNLRRARAIKDSMGVD